MDALPDRRQDLRRWCSMAERSRKGCTPRTAGRGDQGMTNQNIARRDSAGLTALLGSTAADAQAPFPSRPIKVLVTIPPGGAPDISARLLGQYLQETLGWTVVIENRPGANGNIAAAEVVKSAPDGYTLILAADSGITINPHVYSKLTFDPLKDLVPVTSVATNQFMLSVNPGVPAKTFQEFIDYARKTKPPLPYASGGNGSQHQLMHGDAQAARRHRPPARAVPGRGAGDAGDGRGRHQGAVLGVGERHADPERAIARARHQRQEPLQALPRAADHRRVLSRLCGRHLARPVRPARHAGADHDHLAHRDPEDHGPSGFRRRSSTSRAASSR